MRRVLVSHKLKEADTGVAGVDEFLNLQLREHVAHTFEDIRFLMQFSPPYEITGGETDGGITPTDYRYPPGHVFRYGADPGGIIDAGPAIQNAMDSGATDVIFPAGYYAVGVQLRIKSGGTQNLRWIGQGRTNTYIYPITDDFSVSGSPNAMIVNENSNAKFSLKSLRFSSDVIGGLPPGGFPGAYLYAEQTGAYKVLFSGEFDDLWYSPSSLTNFFFQGGLQNFRVTNGVWEGCRTPFYLTGPFNYDIIFDNHAFYAALYGFIDASSNSSTSITVGSTAGSATVTSASASSAHVGKQLSADLGSGIADAIPHGARVMSVSAGVSLTLDVKATATNASLACQLDDMSQLITVNNVHIYSQQVAEYAFKVKAGRHWKFTNVGWHMTTTPLSGNVGAYDFDRCSDMLLDQCSVAAEQATGTNLAQSFKLQGSHVRIANTYMRGGAVGVLLAGDRKLDVEISDSTITDTTTSAIQVLSGTAPGRVTVRGSDLTRNQNTAWLNSASGWRCSLSLRNNELQDNLWNAGGAATPIDITTSGAVRIESNRVGRTLNLSNISYLYIIGPTGNDARQINNEVLTSGTPITGVVNPASTGTLRNYGSFTLAAAATTTINDVDVRALSNIALTPTNAAGATLISGAKSLYISNRTEYTSFAVATADGTAAAGTENFSYRIFN